MYYALYNNKKRGISMNQVAFNKICEQITSEAVKPTGIGTLSEKTIHAVLKTYCSPDPSTHEIKVGRYYADILKDNHIIEIQTRHFHLLKRKLSAFLPNYPVTIVYPIAHYKWLRWVNEDTGEISKPRKSPKTGVAAAIFPELYKIKDYLLDPNLSFQIILLDVEEYRLLNGWSKDRKKGSNRSDGLPIRLHEEITLSENKDFEKLLPETLPPIFSTKDYKKTAHVSQKCAWTALNILSYLNIIQMVGKTGNLHLFKRNQD